MPSSRQCGWRRQESASPASIRRRRSCPVARPRSRHVPAPSAWLPPTSGLPWCVPPQQRRGDPGCASGADNPAAAWCAAQRCQPGPQSISRPPQCPGMTESDCPEPSRDENVQERGGTAKSVLLFVPCEIPATNSRTAILIPAYALRIGQLDTSIRQVAVGQCSEV